MTSRGARRGRRTTKTAHGKDPRGVRPSRPLGVSTRSHRVDGAVDLDGGASRAPPAAFSGSRALSRSSRPGAPLAQPVQSTSSSDVDHEVGAGGGEASSSSARASPARPCRPPWRPGSRDGVLDSRSSAPAARRARRRRRGRSRGCGLPCAKSRPERSASKKSSRREPGPQEVVRRGRSPAANVSSRIWRRNSSAFFDEEAAATRMPAARTAMTKRSASGKAWNSPGLDQLDDHRLLALGVLVGTRARRRAPRSAPARRVPRSCAACRT